MSVFKYVTAEGALRFLQTWALRITPPDQFNDPFEMRPTIDLSGMNLTEEAPQRVWQNLAAHLAQMAAEQGWAAGADEAAPMADALVAFLMHQMTAEDEMRFIDTAAQRVPGGKEALFALRPHFDDLYEKAMGDAHAQLPAFSKLAQAAMHQTLPKHMGVLCFSGSGKHPLMWAHYTDSHKGALLEFDENAPCFNRRRHAEDEFGVLRRVRYADSRPSLNVNGDSDAMVALALTKALEWAYEQEVRLLWPLELADRTVDAGEVKVRLFDVPATALRSITLGCKATETFAADVARAMAAAGSSSRIAIRRASMDDLSFSLNYRDVA